MGVKIFITGGTGFIGTPLVKKLQERGHFLKLLSCDLAETEKWKKEIEEFKPDAAVHLAWEGLPDYGVEMSKKNIKYSLDLFNFLKEMGCKTVLSVGSAFEKTNPEDIFPVAKKIVNFWGKAVIENFIWARIFYVYGPGQRETSLIPYLIRCAKKGENPEINNPLAQQDYIYIDDVAEALALLLEKSEKSKEYEIGWGKLIPNQEIVNIVAKEFSIKDWQKNIEKLEKSEFVRPAENSGLKAMGWEPKISIEEGIQKMINHYSPSPVLRDED
ncbi:MAG: NAD(P)-dependent oxidoreductase [bacterium]|nr:NAD(P)-dependent oxidoreductase [bacterium]